MPRKGADTLTPSPSLIPPNLWEEIVAFLAGQGHGQIILDCKEGRIVQMTLKRTVKPDVRRVA